MASPFLLAVPVTIVPAMATLWWFLKRYEGAFEDARVFFSLVVGFFLGIVGVFLEFVAFQFHNLGLPPGQEVSLFVAGYAFFEAGLLTAILGLRRFRARKDTPYYGTAMGLGYGAMWALGIVALNINLSRQPEYADYTAITFTGMVLIPLGAILAGGATGAWIGKGSAAGNLGKGWLTGAFLRMPVFLALWAALPSFGHGQVLTLVPSIGALAYGVTLLLIAQARVLDQVVPPELRDILTKNRRRDERRRMRDAEAKGKQD